MNRLARQLDQKLSTLDPECARKLELRVRDALEQAEQDAADNRLSAWPVGYFESTAGALAGEEFQRPAQGELPQRDVW